MLESFKDEKLEEKSLQIPCGLASVTLFERDVRQVQEAIIRHLPDGALRNIGDAVMSYFVINCMK